MHEYSPETEDFFLSRPKAEDEKSEVEGHIVVYGLRRPHIYNIYSTLSYQIQFLHGKDLAFNNMQRSKNTKEADAVTLIGFSWKQTARLID